MRKARSVAVCWYETVLTRHKLRLCAALNGDFVQISEIYIFSPFPLAERGAPTRDEAAVVLVLLGVVLQEGVLVPVQVVH